MTQVNLSGRAQPLEPVKSSGEDTITSLPAKQDYNSISQRLGYYSTNLTPRDTTCSLSPDICIREELYKCNFGGKNAYERNEKVFIQYIKDKSNLDLFSFCIERIDNELVYDARRHEYRHRWTVGYKKKFLYRLHLLEEWYKWLDIPVTFLTVTTRQDLSIEDQILLLKDGFSRIKTKYRKHFGKMVYLSAMDFHKTGYAHIHCVIFNNVPKYFISLMATMWEKRNYGSSEHGLKWKFKKNREIAKIVNYLFKHTGKVFNLNAPGAMRFHSTIFAMQHCENKEYPGVRLFSMSSEIAKVMKIKERDRACISFQLDEKLLYLDENMTQSEAMYEIDKYKKWFGALNFD